MKNSPETNQDDYTKCVLAANAVDELTSLQALTVVAAALLL
jgi:hypothetical protein